MRVTTTDALLCGLFTPIFAAFRETHPEIALEVVVSNHPFNLSRREGDVAIRPTLSPPEMLIGRRIGTLAHAVYGRSGVASAADGGRDPAADWIGWDELMLHPPLERWMKAHRVDERCRYRVNTVTGMLEAVRHGLGLTILPCYLADGDERLARHGDPIPELAVDLWLLTHPDLRRAARIRAFTDFVVATVRGVRDRLIGMV